MLKRRLLYFQLRQAGFQKNLSLGANILLSATQNIINMRGEGTRCPTFLTKNEI